VEVEVNVGYEQALLVVMATNTPREAMGIRGTGFGPRPSAKHALLRARHLSRFASEPVAQNQMTTPPIMRLCGTDPF